jgi:hypothetical protein
VVSTTASKRMIDVEDLVRWACGAVAGGGRGSSPGVPPRGAMNAPRSEASLVGRWTWPTGYPTVSPMFAGAFPKGSPRASDRPDDPGSAIVHSAIGILAGRMAGFAAPEELALDIGLDVDLDGAFAAALANIGNIVIVHGRLGNRPSLPAEIPRPRPKLAPNGKPGVWRIEAMIEKTISGENVERRFEAPVQRTGGETGNVVLPVTRDSYPFGAYGVLEYDPDPQGVVSLRAEYLAWRLALDELAALLHGRLEKFAVLPPAAAMAPWLGHRDGEKHVDLFRAGADRVYSGLDLAAIAARRESRARRKVVLGAGRLRRPARLGRLKTTG